jgi:hypothetical protein
VEWNCCFRKRRLSLWTRNNKIDSHHYLFVKDHKLMIHAKLLLEPMSRKCILKSSLLSQQGQKQSTDYSWIEQLALRLIHAKLLAHRQCILKKKLLSVPTGTTTNTHYVVVRGRTKGKKRTIPGSNRWPFD